VCKRLKLTPSTPDLEEWRGLVERYKDAKNTVNIGLICKYELRDAYLSVLESLQHAGIVYNVKVNTETIHAENICDDNVATVLGKLDGILIPSGYGGRGADHLISAVKYARESKVPFLGIGMGMQCAVLEFARNMAGIAGADSLEANKEAEIPIFVPNPRPATDPPVTDTESKLPMRKGAHPCKLSPGSLLHAAYGEALIYERFRHMYMLNNKYRGELQSHGLLETAHSPDEQRVEAIELPKSLHPWFVGVQFRPEFKSRITRPSPIIKAFLGAALRRQK